MGGEDGIEGLLARFAGPGAEGLTSAEAAALSGEIHEALVASGRDELERVAGELEGSFRRMLAAAPEGVRDAVTGRGSGDLALAYAMGQVSAMQAVTANALVRRADRCFVADLSDGPLARVARILMAGEAESASVAAQAGMSARDAERTLSHMVCTGAVDFRRVSGRLLYFVTPPARAVLESLPSRGAA